jgi:sulfatase maturation enzyme AslB (radical SAM superfamily)
MADKKSVWLWIDPTRRCNLQCALCYTRESHADEDLSIDDFAVMLDRLLGDPGIEIEHVTFNWRGEPLMNKQFVPMMAMLAAAKRSFPVQFHTNAMLLTPKLCERLLEIEQDYTICVSIDGGSRASHDKNRGAGTYDKALRGAHNLLRARGARRNPRVMLYQLDLRDDPASYDPKFVTLTQSVDRWQRVQPVLPSGDTALIASQPEVQGGTDVVLDWPDLPLSAPVPRGPCFWMGNAFCVAPSGDVSVCLLSHRPDGILGNVFHDQPTEIIARSEALRRQVIVEGRDTLAHCRVCRKSEGGGILLDKAA